MKPLWIATLAAAVAATAGCGTLRVKVDVLKPSVVEAELDRLLLRDSLPRVLAQSESRIQLAFSDLLSAHLKVLTLLVAEYRKEASNKPALAADLQAIADGLQANLNRVVPREYQDEETEALALNRRIRQLNTQLATAAPTDRPATQAALVAVLRELQLRLESFDQKVKRNVGDQAQKAKVDMPRLADAVTARATGIPQAIAEMADKRKSLIANQGIVESPYAYVVAAAPDNEWSPRFNEVYGVGELGNLNVAIKMVSLGDFTLKGVTFDPSDVIRATSRVFSQAVVLAAQAYGVPIKPPAAGASGQPPATGTALATSSERLETLQQTAAAREAKLQDYRSALTTIALAITREQAKLAGTDAERKAAIDAIKATFDAHKARLNLSSLQGATQ
jgi:hypothetical protein